MPTTIYGSIDLGTPTPFGVSFTNCSDIGSAPFSPHFSGSFSDIAFHKTVDQQQDNTIVGGGGWFSVINHATALNPVPANAKIRRIVMSMQSSGATATADMDATFAAGNIGVPPSTRAILALTLSIFSSAPGGWETGAVSISANAVDDKNGFPHVVSHVSSSQPGVIVSRTYDFTLNPAGAFPLQYMTYDQFIANFQLAFFSESVSCGVNAQWNIHPQPGTATIDGTDSASATLQASNWEMTVEWDIPTTWTLSSANPLVLPDNIIRITRPEPDLSSLGGDTSSTAVPGTGSGIQDVSPSGVAGLPDDYNDIVDVEQVQRIRIGDRIIEPDDPWVILWLRFTIVFILPADVRYDPSTPVELEYVGREFDGFVASIPLTITYADLSGIYQLDDSIHHDVLYERTSTPTTQDVLIPAPHFVTHFVNTPETDICHFTGTRMRVTGQGTVKQVIQSQDYIVTLEFGNIILRTSYNRSLFSLVNFVDQNASIRVYMDEFDDYMNVSQLIIFVKPIFTDYPR